MSESSTATRSSTVETFSLHPYSENINPSTVEGRKLYLAATKELGKDERISVSIENGHIVKNHLETLSSKYSWGLLVSKVPDSNGNLKDIIKNYKNLTCEDVLAFNNTYLGNGLNEAPPADRIMQTLDPANNQEYRAMFYKRVRSKMISQALEGHCNQVSWNKIMNKKKYFTWYETSGEIFYDGLMICKIVMDICNPETKVGVQVLRNKIAETKSATFKHKIPDMLEHIKSTMDLIEEMGETHDNLLKDTFGALLTAPNTRFTQFFEHEKMLWEAGKHYDFDTLDSMAKTVYNNMCTDQSWNALDPKDAKIVALRTEINNVREELKKAHDNNTKSSSSGTPDFTIDQWRKEKGPDEIAKDGVKYWFCPRHKGPDYDGLYVRHKPEDHDDVMARRRRGKKNRRGYEDPKKKAPKEDDATKSQQRKLILNKGMKAALLTIGAFTEEQADAIVTETQSNLPKDF